jgi:biopolymer transport protein ExbD
MASLSLISTRARRRAVNSELPLVPFIDFLICLIAFLALSRWPAEPGELR